MAFSHLPVLTHTVFQAPRGAEAGVGLRTPPRQGMTESARGQQKGVLGLPP